MLSHRICCALFITIPLLFPTCISYRKGCQLMDYNLCSKCNLQSTENNPHLRVIWCKDYNDFVVIINPYNRKWLSFAQTRKCVEGGYCLYELFQDSIVVGVHIIFFAPIGWTLCTVWNADRQAGLKLGNGYIGLVTREPLAMLRRRSWLLQGWNWY